MLTENTLFKCTQLRGRAAKTHMIALVLRGTRTHVHADIYYMQMLE